MPFHQISKQFSLFISNFCIPFSQIVVISDEQYHNKQERHCVFHVLDNIVVVADTQKMAHLILNFIEKIGAALVYQFAPLKF